MINELYVQIVEMLQSNQFLSGGAVLGIIGGMVVWLRKIPYQLYELIKRQIVVEIEVYNTDDIFEWIVCWFNKKNYIKRSNLLRLSSMNSTNNDESNDDKFLLSPGIGHHYFWYNKALFWLARSKEEQTSGSTYNPKIVETMKICTLKWFKNRAIELLWDITKEHIGTSNESVNLYIACYGNWKFKKQLGKRPIGSIALDDDIGNNLIADIVDFKLNEDYYREKGIPYRRGYLFSGPPGTGKTSTIIAIASHFNADIYYLNLNQQEISDTELNELMCAVPKHNFIVIEDMDTASVSDRDNEKKDSKDKISFSGLLNAIDGIGAYESNLLFVTTNRPQILDSALIRPGRIDKHIKFDYASKKQIEEMFAWLCDDYGKSIHDEVFNEIATRENLTTADVQGIILQKRNMRK